MLTFFLSARVLYTCVFKSTSAPDPKSSAATLSEFFSAAQWRAVRPTYQIISIKLSAGSLTLLLAFTSAPADKISSATSNELFSAA